MRPYNLSRPFKIQCCKDGTLTVRGPGERVFNDRALPVYSCRTRRRAEALITFTCGTVRAADGTRPSHPLMPGQPWFKINIHDGWREDGLPAVLELEHLDIVSERLRAADVLITKRNAELKAQAR